MYCELGSCWTTRDPSYLVVLFQPLEFEACKVEGRPLPKRLAPFPKGHNQIFERSQKFSRSSHVIFTGWAFRPGFVICRTVYCPDNTGCSGRE